MSGTRKKRMRLPNGIGSVHKINDGKRRRNPWRARVPSHVEFNPETGKASQKYINIGYYATETEAIEALFEYRKNPYTLESSVATFADVYEMWSKKKFTTVSKIAQNGYSASYKHSEHLHSMKMRDIRSKDYEFVMTAVAGGYQVQTKIKTLWGQLNKYAMEHDIIQKDYSEFVGTRDKAPETTRTAISNKDIQKLWGEIDKGNDTAEIAMIYIYTGLRATELLEVTKDKVFLDERYMIAGKKTDAGRDRIIPIHRAILPLIEKRMVQEGETLISGTATSKTASVSYGVFSNRWEETMKELGMQYTIHYTRHTCATLMREAGIAEDIRKLILGHKSSDITDRYTHISKETLIAELDKLAGR